MPIVLRLDRVMAQRKISLNELAQRVGIANVNLSNIKTGKIRAIRFSTLEAICDVLDCQPGDLLEFRREGEAPAKEQPAAVTLTPGPEKKAPDNAEGYQPPMDMWTAFLTARGWDGTFE